MANAFDPKNPSDNPSNVPAIFREKMLRLSQAARRLPAIRNAKSADTAARPPHPSTLLRWWKVGLKSRSGKTVKLDVRKVGSANCTSLEALERFFNQLDDLDPINPPKSSVQIEKALRYQADQALKILRNRGLLQ